MRERELKHVLLHVCGLFALSLPMRERELKPCRPIPTTRYHVAPHAGARIETPGARRRRCITAVAPHAGARIETRICVIWRGNAVVAPHAGARIETILHFFMKWLNFVAPHAGARIETDNIAF